MLTGPSGAGKSTLLRCLNRLQELRPGLSVQADITLDGVQLYGESTDPDSIRRKIGFLFQQPVVFPKSIRQNLTLALGPAGIPRREWSSRIEDSLRQAALWNEVAPRLEESATVLSIGQQQRLCLARALAVEPEVLLLDEPTSSLDRASTLALEASLTELSQRVPMILVTHDEAQADRVASRQLHLDPGDGLQGATLTDPLVERLERLKTSPGFPTPARLQEV